MNENKRLFLINPRTLTGSRLILWEVCVLSVWQLFNLFGLAIWFNLLVQCDTLLNDLWLMSFSFVYQWIWVKVAAHTQYLTWMWKCAKNTLPLVFFYFFIFIDAYTLCQWQSWEYMKSQLKPRETVNNGDQNLENSSNVCGRWKETE